MINSEEAKKIIGALIVSYPNYKPTDLQMAVDMYRTMFQDYTYKEVMLAVQRHIATDTSGFAPTIGQIIDKIHKNREPEQLTPQEAWVLVYKAICNSTYNAEAEYNKLPTLVQKAVGSPEALRSLASSSDFNEEVEKSLFTRNFNTVMARSNEDARLPQTVKNAIQIAESEVKQIATN